MRLLPVLLPLLVASSLLAGCSGKPPAASADAAGSAGAGREGRSASGRDPAKPEGWTVSAGALLHYLVSAPAPVGQCSAFTFPVAAGAADLVAGAGHAVINGGVPPGVGVVHLELVAPDGTVLRDPHALGAGPVEVAAPTFVVVETPAAGDWTLRVTPSSPMVDQDIPLGYQFELDQADEPPAGTIDGPQAC